MSKKRYILYLDILGFRELVKSEKASNIYNIIDTALEKCKIFDKQDYYTIYFSDTIIICQKKIMAYDESLEKLLVVSSFVFCSLLAEHIPVRGIITFDNFFVKNDKKTGTDIYFGRALIDSYDKEKRQNWLGIIVNESATRNISKRMREKIKKDKMVIPVYRRSVDIYCDLNPFFFLTYYSGCKVKNVKSYAYKLVLKAIKYIEERVKYYTNNNIFHTGDSTKYFSTLAFIYSIYSQKYITQMKRKYR